jgi:hypothetical protein
MLLPIAIALGTLVVARELEKRADGQREVTVKDKIKTAVEDAVALKDNEWREKVTKAAQRRKDLKMKRLERENREGKLIAMRGGNGGAA